MIVDATTRESGALEKALNATGMDVRFESFEGVPTRRQAELVAGAAVLVAAHGAGMTNLIFLSPKVRPQKQREV